MPGTRVRRVGGLCSLCHNQIISREAREKRITDAAAAKDRAKFIPLGEPDPHVVAGLEGFLAARRARETATARRLYPGMATPRTATA